MEYMLHVIVNDKYILSIGGCVFKGRLYQQGNRWDDGCTYKCECLDSTSGQYRCTDRYILWLRQCPNNIAVLFKGKPL